MALCFNAQNAKPNLPMRLLRICCNWRVDGTKKTPKIVRRILGACRDMKLVAGAPGGQMACLKRTPEIERKTPAYGCCIAVK